MITREYECTQCELDAYFTVSRSVTDPTKEVCPTCGAPADQIHTVAPTSFFGKSFSESGGIPDYKTCRSEYREWQKEKFAKAQQDLHPANVGTTVVTEESYAPKEAMRAVKAAKEKKAAPK